MASLLKNLAEAFDKTKEYSVGDTVVQNGRLYLCINSTTGDFDTSSWEEKYLTDMMKGVVNSNLKGTEVTVEAIDDDPYDRGHLTSDGKLVFETGLTEIYGIINLNIYPSNSGSNWGDLTSITISGGTVTANITGTAQYMKGSITVKGK